MDFKNNVQKFSERIKSQCDVVNTDEKLEAYNIIRNILRKNIDVGKIIYKDFKSYFVLSAFEQIRWVCRLHFEYRKKTIGFPLENYKGEKLVEIESINDIFKYSDLLVKSLETAKKSYYIYNKE